MIVERAVITNAETASESDARLVAAFARLVPQLSSAPPPSLPLASVR
ncbi:MAG: hypothetical protein M3619_12360 [Myxococcota bacterium]|nr:hypothetical protein [Myxococcota bacterium]